jgi:hypothetical protein
MVYVGCGRHHIPLRRKRWLVTIACAAALVFAAARLQLFGHLLVAIRERHRRDYGKEVITTLFVTLIVTFWQSSFTCLLDYSILQIRRPRRLENVGMKIEF